MGKLDLNLDTEEFNYRDSHNLRPWWLVVNPVLKTVVQDSLVQPDFSIDILQILHDTVDGLKRTLVAETVSKEFRSAQYEGVFLKNLTPFINFVRTALGLGEEDDINESAKSLEVSDQYISQLHARVDNARDIVVRLTEILENPQIKQHIHPFIIEVNRLLNEGKVQEVYRMVCDFCEDENLTASDENVREVFSLLMYLPSKVRYAVQYLLVFNYMIGYAKQLKAQYGGDSEAQASIDDFIEYCRFSQKYNYHWGKLTDDKLWDEPTVLKQLIGMDSRTINLAERNRARPSALEAFEKCADRFEILQHTIKPDYHPDIAATDPGHMLGFCGLQYTEKLLRTSPEKYPKDGRIAVILEDCPEQAEHWKKCIEKASSFSLPDGGLISSAADFGHWMKANADCYILDIENGTDRDAGIRIAEELIKIFIAEINSILTESGCTLDHYIESEKHWADRYFRPTPEFEKFNSLIEKIKKRIIVFSSSEILVQEARRRLLSLIGQYMPLFTKESYSPFYVTIKTKQGFRFDDLRA